MYLEDQLGEPLGVAGHDVIGHVLAIRDERHGPADGDQRSSDGGDSRSPSDGLGDLSEKIDKVTGNADDP